MIIINSYSYAKPLFLDLYPTASVAFSLRKLRNGYSGPCIRVRRSNDSAEQDIGFDSNGNLDTVSLLSFVGAGNDGFVKTWYDQSGNSKHFIQTTTTAQPQVVSLGALNLLQGLPSIKCDSDDLFFASNVTLPTYTSMFITGAFTGNYSISHGDFFNGFSYGLSNSGFQIRFYRSSSTHSYSSGSFVINSNSLRTLFYGSSVSGDLKTYFSLNERSGYLQSGTLLPNTNHTATLGMSTPGTIQEFIIYPNNKLPNFVDMRNNINNYFKVWSSAPIWDGAQTRILDTYSGSKVAYSTRSLSSTYKGPLLRAIRPDFIEIDIYALENGELDTTFLSNFTGSGNCQVVSWYDQSGNGLNIAAFSTAITPLIISSGTLLTEKGKPTLRFDGINDGLWFMNTDIFRNKTSATIFVAARWITLPGATRTLVTATTNASPGNAPRVNLHGNSANRTNMAGRRLDGDSTQNTPSVTPISTANMYLVTGVIDWGNSDAFVYLNNQLDATNNSFSTSGATSDTQPFSFSVGNLSNAFGRGQNSNSNISEVIVYETIPDINGINTSINSIYNIYP